MEESASLASVLYGLVRVGWRLALVAHHISFKYLVHQDDYSYPVITGPAPRV